MENNEMKPDKFLYLDNLTRKDKNSMKLKDQNRQLKWVNKNQYHEN